MCFGHPICESTKTIETEIVAMAPIVIVAADKIANSMMRSPMKNESDPRELHPRKCGVAGVTLHHIFRG